MKSTAKYLFDMDFGATEKPTITLVEHERRREDAESQAFRKGFAAAEAKAHEQADQRIAVALGQIADGIDTLNRNLRAVEAKLETEAVHVAVAVASKLAPELVAREPFAEIEALATECFRHLVATPHVTIRIHDGIYAAAKEKLEEIAQARGFQGRLAVTAEPQIAVGDCRIEWADGGINRDRAAAAAAIDDVVGRYVAARVAPADQNFGRQQQ